MSLLSKLKAFWYNQWDIPLPKEKQALEDDIASSDAVVMYAVSKYLEPPQPKGGVVKVKHKQYVPDEHRHGGRVVKLMPKQLRHMKELAEKTDE